MGKALIVAGIVLIAVGLFWVLADRIGLGRLPGDIVVERENFRFYLPLATGLLISVILSVVLWLIGRF